MRVVHSKKLVYADFQTVARLEWRAFKHELKYATIVATLGEEKSKLVCEFHPRSKHASIRVKLLVHEAFCRRRLQGAESICRI